ncbi:MAG: dethiobiotin synthase, partial [Gammaproteobacteria bacterium]
MKTQLPKQIFVTGTGTDVGKTVISAILVAGLNAKYWKPVQCGLDNPTDSQWIQQKTAVPESFIFKEAYALQQPLSPHAAAELEDTEILMSNFTLPDVHHDEHLIVEGAGGIMVPLNKDKLVLDLI